MGPVITDAHPGAGTVVSIPAALELPAQDAKPEKLVLLSVPAKLLNAIGSLWIFGLMCMMLADLSARFFFNRPIDGVAELAGLSIVAIVYLQLASTVLSGRMTRADFISDWIANRRPLWGHAMSLGFQLAGGLVMAGLSWVSWAPLMSAWSSSETLGTPGVFQVATWPYRGAVLLGSALATLCYVALAKHEFMRLIRQGARS